MSGTFRVFVAAIAVGVLGLMMQALGARSAFAQQQFTLIVHFDNPGSDPLFLTFWDLNSGQSSPVLVDAEISSQSTFDQTVIGDSSGSASIRWRAKVLAGGCKMAEQSNLNGNIHIDLTLPDAKDC